MKAISRLQSLAVVLLLAGLTFAAALHAQSRGANTPVRGGNGTMYVGGWPDSIFIIDEATEKVTGKIPMQTGTPRNLTLSHDGTRFYVRKIDMEEIEVVDIATRKSIDRFKLSEGRNQVRIFALAVDPQDRHLVLMTVTTRKLLDRFEIGPTATSRLRSESPYDIAHNPMAGGRGAAATQPDHFAGRQVSVCVLRRRIDLRHDRLQTGR